MQLFNCPFCGPRDQSEFTYGREVAPIPALDASRAEWERYVFERDNPAGPHAEWWHHNLGCRQWLVITRDTRTHEVLAIEKGAIEKGARHERFAQDPAAQPGSPMADSR